MERVYAGAAVADISPRDSQHLFGYPHVERYSRAIHDPLLSSALYLADAQTELVFIANDIIFVSKATTARVRQGIEAATGVPGKNILISATHTHSGPPTVDYISLEEDVHVSRTDPRYLEILEAGAVAAASESCRRARPAEVGLGLADGTGVGTNRRDPSGPADLEVPVLMVRAWDTHRPIACMVVCSMHPTVLHEDSLLVSGDFPAMTRQFLQREFLGHDCPVLYHTGPAGNQSPRHVVREHTMDEAARLGAHLGRAIVTTAQEIVYTSDARLRVQSALVDLPRRPFPPPPAAEGALERAARHLHDLRQKNAPWQQMRTAEVDWFGAEETLRLARAAQEGRLEAAYQSCLPAEVQLLTVGPWSFIGWPGEIFVEYALAVKRQKSDTYIISLANGELQGYLVTEEAVSEGGYEVSNAIFAPASGKVLVETALQLAG
jgi:neutral ceramidase